MEANDALFAFQNWGFSILVSPLVYACSRGLAANKIFPDVISVPVMKFSVLLHSFTTYIWISDTLLNI